MTRYVPTELWTDTTIDIPDFGLIKKSNLLELCGHVESYLLMHGYVRRFKQSDAIPVVQTAAPPPSTANKQSTSTLKKSGQQSSSDKEPPVNNQEPPTE